MRSIRLGTASWTERTLLESGAFYPAAVRTPEERLRYYARHFSLVEVDASYYALPSVRNAQAWVERTPDDFVFGIKAYAALTQHPLEPGRLDRDLRTELPPHLARQPRVYTHDLPGPLLDTIWDRFRAALEPLRKAGKLGYVLFQMPPWFRPTHESHLHLEAVAARLHDVPVAVEFRQALWMADRLRPRTLDFLRQHRLSYVCVDEPQGTPASVPPLAESTSDAMAVVRFHGRRRETWNRRGVGTTERFRYLYAREELSEWVPRLHALARRTRDVYAVMNNCYREYGVQNAKDMAALLASGAGEPSPGA